MTRRQVLFAGAAAAAFSSVSQSFARTRPVSSKPRRLDYRVEHVDLPIPTLHPAHEGLRVAQLSDIHTGHLTPDARVLSAVATVNELAPDLALLTGDYVTWKNDAAQRVGELLKGIRAPCVAVLGNHDHWTYPDQIKAELEHCGYAVLLNQNTQLTVKGEPVTFLGVDDGHTRRDDVSQTLRGARTEGTRLVLAHTPHTFNKLPVGLGVPCFSGHTHGGQVMIPGITPLIMRSQGEPYVRGEYRQHGNLLYVNRGLGIGQGLAMPRIGSDPEVTLFTLRGTGAAARA